MACELCCNKTVILKSEIRILSPAHRSAYNFPFVDWTVYWKLHYIHILLSDTVERRGSPHKTVHIYRQLVGTDRHCMCAHSSEHCISHPLPLRELNPQKE